jgi:MFS family permease
MVVFEELIDSNGKRISRHDLTVAMGVSTAAGSLGSAWFAMTLGMPLIMFMQAIGASGVLIGLVTTVRLLAMSAQIPAALASEHVSCRKVFWSRFALIHRLLWFVIAGMAWWCSPPEWWLPFAVVAVVGASDFLANASAPSWLSWMADLIPLPIAGRFWGVRQSVITAASLCGLALAGQILDAVRDPVSGAARPIGFAIVFTIGSCLGVADVLVNLFVREPRLVPSPPGIAFHRRILAPFANRNFRLLTLSLGAWNFALSMIGSFALVYLKRDFGVTYSQLAALSIAATLGAIVTGYGFGKIMDRVGARPLASILILAAPLPLAAWLFVDHRTVSIGPFILPQFIALLSVAGIVSGGLWSAVGLCQYRLAAELSSPQGRTMSMAVHWSFVGLLSALGPTAGGLVMDHFPNPARLQLTIISGLPFSFYNAQLILFTTLLLFVALPLMLAIRTAGSE